MRKSPRFLLLFIILLTVFSILIQIPKNISFREGLDLAGGTSLTFKVDMASIPSAGKDKALEAAKTVIDKRVNLFGVSEPIVQTSIVGKESRIIVELPGVDINQAKKIVGTTAELSFWEESPGKNIATPSGYPLNLSLDYKKTDLSGNDLKETNVAFDPNNGKPQVQLNFTDKGSKKFADITKRNVNKIVAIVLDNEVIEAPRVNDPILTGNAVITGGFTFESAKALSTQLNAGALPVPLILLQEHAVDPTLGASSLKMSLFAGFLGFVIIVIFMIVMYGKLGILATVALSIYTLMVLAIFKLSALTPYAITLTLSGIAGFILSIGMAVDANILVFERMKEEIRNGRSKELVLDLGFLRAWTSIRDSNISTIITSIVLYEFGTGIVRGFALVLAIGVLVSMFSAIVVTKTLLKFIYR